MAEKKRKEIKFYYRGQIERGANYRWTNGYSETINGNVAYPWLTRRECQLLAKHNGGKAVFVTGSETI